MTSLVLVLTALSSLHTAALLGSIGRVRETARRDSSVATPWVRGTAWILVGVALPPTVIWLAQAVSIAASAGYGALYDRDLQSGVLTTSLLLSGWLVPGMLFLTISGRTHRTDARVATALMLGFV